MPERRSIGQILTDMGRITDEDVQRALEYQSNHGGFFGEALIALDIVTAEEFEWSLASQFDLPYIVPDADSVDPEAVALVTPEWALAHLALPIMRTETTLTVVVDSPMKSEAIGDLEARSRRDVELALASAANIRALIRQVFARRAEDEPEVRPSPVTLEEGFELALNAAANRFGISTRGHRSWFWFDDGGTVERRLLEVSWTAELDRIVSPAPLALVAGKKEATFEAEISREGVVNAAEIRYLSDESGGEFLFRPIRAYSKLHDRYTPPAPGILEEIRILVRAGSARFLVGSSDEALAREITPHLPALLLDPSWRCLHVCAEGQPDSDEVFSRLVASDPEAWAVEAEALRAFHFDAVTVDATGTEPGWGLHGLEVAAVAFVFEGEAADRQAAHDAGIRWEIEIERREGERLEWSLRPLKV